MKNEKFNYILSYIHEDMLCDKKTTLAYLDDIAKEATELKDQLHRRNKLIAYLREEHKQRGKEIVELKKRICDLALTGCEFFIKEL